MKSLLFCLFVVCSFVNGFAQPNFGATIEGPILLEDTPGHIIMKSGDGSYWTLTVDGNGQLRTTAATFTNIEITLPNDQTYTRDVSVGDEEAVSVFLQASHFNQSTIVMDASTNWAHHYRYSAQSNYIGHDKVTLLLATGSDGASPNTHFEYLTIEFTLTN